MKYIDEFIEHSSKQVQGEHQHSRNNLFYTYGNTIRNVFYPDCYYYSYTIVKFDYNGHRKTELCSLDICTYKIEFQVEGKDDCITVDLSMFNRNEPFDSQIFQYSTANDMFGLSDEQFIKILMLHYSLIDIKADYDKKFHSIYG